MLKTTGNNLSNSGQLNSTKYFYGIDLLKIISMFMVVVLHVLLNTHILDPENYGAAHYQTSWFIEIFCYCAVNCYAMISGFLIYGKNNKYSRIIDLWLQVISYSVLITIAFKIAFPELYGIKHFIKAFLPISFSSYWYFSSYFAMFLFIPLLNKVTEALSKRGAIIMLFIAVLFGVFSTFTDPFRLLSGYSTAWLCILFIIGACIRKFEFYKCFKRPSVLLLIFAVSGVATWVSRFAIKKFVGLSFIDNLVSYTAPLIFVMAVALVLFFANVEIPKILIKSVRLLSSTSFSVYIIHTNPLIFDFVSKDKLTFLLKYDEITYIFLVLAIAVGTYIVCSLVEIIRVKVFKLLRINKISNAIGSKLDKSIQFFE